MTPITRRWQQRIWVGSGCRDSHSPPVSTRFPSITIFVYTAATHHCHCRYQCDHVVHTFPLATATAISLTPYTPRRSCIRIYARLELPTRRHSLVRYFPIPLPLPRNKPRHPVHRGPSSSYTLWAVNTHALKTFLLKIYIYIYLFLYKTTATVRKSTQSVTFATVKVRRLTATPCTPTTANSVSESFNSLLWDRLPSPPGPFPSEHYPRLYRPLAPDELCVFSTRPPPQTLP